MDNTSLSILADIYEKTHTTLDGLEIRSFRALHHKHRTLIDSLKSDRYIFEDDFRYFLGIISLQELTTANISVKKLTDLMSTLFDALHSFYLEKQTTALTTDELCTIVGLPKEEVVIGLSYLKQLSIFSGCGSNDGAIFTMNVSENILDSDNLDIAIKKFSDVISANKATSLQRQPASLGNNYHFSPPFQNPHIYAGGFVDFSRISELKNIECDLDLRRLIKICEELNFNFSNENYISVAALSRILVDHIPPIFGRKNFSEVANNQQGPSIRSSMLNLENSMKKVADRVMHQQIRPSDALPTKASISFQADIDALLGEVIILLKRPNA